MAWACSVCAGNTISFSRRRLTHFTFGPARVNWETPSHSTTNRVCKWPNGLLARPTGRVERVDARVAKEELRATPVVRPAQPAIRQTTPGVRRTSRRLGLEPTLPNPRRPNRPPAAEASCGVWDVERAGWRAWTTKREGGAFTRAANGGGLVLQTRRDRGSSFRMLHPAGRGLDRSWPNPRCLRSAAG